SHTITMFLHPPYSPSKPPPHLRPTLFPYTTLFRSLIEAIAEKKNPTVAGLDPKLDYVPEYIRKQSFEKYGFTLEGAADALLTFKDRKSTRLNSSHVSISYAVFCLKKKK